MRQINHSEDLARLSDDGVQYSIIKGAYLVVEAVPYLDNKKQLMFGKLIFQLNISGENLCPPADHTAYWAGEMPCNIDGSFITGLVNGPSVKTFGDGIISDYFLSRKPVENGGMYKSYYEKVTQHINMISAPAKAIYPIGCVRVKSTPILPSEDLPFVYADTNASRANITGVSECMEHQKLAIVGLGGTGMYLLDLLAKCPVEEIHLFDDDIFDNHNAFRAPGAASLSVLNQQPTKVQYASAIYGNMKRGIIPHCQKIMPENISELDDMDFVFICVDSSDVRNMIANYLADHDKSFIDSGLGLESVNGHIAGQVRVTTAISGHYEHLGEDLSSKGDDNEPYATNIQIAELNSIAAAYSVIRWKQLLGFYGDTSSSKDLSFVYCVSSNNIIGHRKYED